MMRRFLLALVVLAVSVAAGAPAPPAQAPPPDPFPELEPRCDLPAGFEWVLTDGPDFYVWTAQRGRDVSAGIGMYFGFHPDSDAPDGAAQEDGTVASQPVRWSVWKKGPKHYRECHLTHEALKIHVWVFARDKRVMDKLVASLRSVTFAERTEDEAEG